MSLTSADEKVIHRIKEGEHKAYPEDRYVDPAIMPGAIVFFLSLIFVLFSFIFPSDTPLFFEPALIGTIIGMCLLVPGIAVWYHFRTVYSYLGLRRFQLALSITALDLMNHGHKDVKPLIDPIYPSEYQYLTLFTSMGPGNLLKRIQGVHWDSETLSRMTRQAETFSASLIGLSGALAILGGLILLPAYILLFLMSGSHNMFLLVLGVMIFILGGAMLFHARRKIRSIKDATPSEIDSIDIPQLSSFSPSECSVDDVLSLIRLAYSHPLRILVVGKYNALEYTGRVYHTGSGIELLETYLLPTIGEK